MTVGEIPLKRMQKNCSLLLDRYIEIARATCEMVCTIRNLPVSKDHRLVIYLQRKKENEALAAYQKASRALMTALENEPDAANAADSPAPRPPGKARSPRLAGGRRTIRHTGS